MLASGISTPGFGADEPMNPTNYDWHQVENRMRIAGSDLTKYEVNGSELRLDSGSLLLEALTPSTIKLRLSEVQVKPKSLVFVRARDGCEHVFVLLGSAPVTVGRHRTALNTGEEVVVTDHEPNYRDLVGQDDIGRRRVRLTPLPDKKCVALSEFSLIQAVEREPLIHELVHSPDAHDKALKDRLIKTAAVLNIVTARHGQYSAGMR
jgi:hypothetical protein